MPDPTPPSGPGPDRIDLLTTDDVRSVVHRVVACLARGGLAIVPTEGGPALAAGAQNPQAIDRLTRLRGASPGDRPVGQIALLEASEALDWVGPLDGLPARIAGRGWPGPLTLLLDGDASKGLAAALDPAVRPAFGTDRRIGFRCPSESFVRQVLSLVAGPVVLARAEPVSGATAELGRLGAADLIVDSGPFKAPPAERPTVVRFEGDRLEIVRAGRVDEASLRRMAAKTILFICTGNTCRSPMAEAIFKAMLANRLRCQVGDLKDRGFSVRSAGLGAGRGMPAATNAREVVKAFGGSLDQHASQPARDDLLRQADLILAMTADHLDALAHYFPEAAPRAFLLDPAGADVDDPVGSDLRTYNRSARHIADLLAHWIDRLVA